MALAWIFVLAVVQIGSMRTASAGIDRWTTQGPTGGSPQGLAIAASRPSTLYASSSGGLFRTDDGARTWYEVNGKFIRSVFVDPRRPQVLFAALNGLIRSPDGGLTWVEIPGPFDDISLITFDPVAVDTLYVADYNDIYRTDDGGHTWAQLAGFSTSGVQSLVASPADPAVLFGTSQSIVSRSTDGGLTWSTVLLASGARCVAVSASDPNVVYVGVDDGVYRSDDDGSTWTLLAGGLSAHPNVSLLLIDPRDSSVVYASSDDYYEGGAPGIYRTTDSGATWALVLPPPIGLPGPVVMDVLHPQILYAAQNGLGVYRTTDRGDHWDLANAGLYLAIGPLAVDPFHPDTVLLDSYRSEDGGQTWRTGAAHGLDVYFIDEFVFDPSREGIVYAATSDGVYKSVDSGLDWRPTALAKGTEAVAVSTSDPSILYAASSPWVLYRSKDAGRSWFLTGFPGSDEHMETIAVSPADPDVAFVDADEDGFWRTTDGGSTWACTCLADVTSVVFDPVTPTTMYAATDGCSCTGWGVLKSLDGGATWKPVNKGLPGHNIEALAIDPTDPNTLYAAVVGQRVYRSQDAGGSWAPFSDGIETRWVWSLAATPSGTTLFSATSSGVYDYEFSA